MLNFMSVLSERIAPTVGGILIALGNILNPGAQIPSADMQGVVTQEVSTTGEVAVEQTSDTENSPSFVRRILSPRPTTPEAPDSAPPQETTSSEVLQIENVEMRVDVGSATVTWTTTVPAESRLIFDNGEGRVLESESGVSQQHRVKVSNLQESEEYDFRITATTPTKSQKDDHYDILYAPKKFTAEIGENDGSCRVLLVKDTAGNAAINKSVQIRPSQVGAGGHVVARGNTTVTTNSRGEIRYCERANTFKLSGKELDITLTTSTPQED